LRRNLPELEFAYAGEAHIARPPTRRSLTDEEWRDFLFIRVNPRGLHFERWRHINGCGASSTRCATPSPTVPDHLQGRASPAPTLPS
jgi:sarcosine oxidase subunit delta